MSYSEEEIFAEDAIEEVEGTELAEQDCSAEAFELSEEDELDVEGGRMGSGGSSTVRLSTKNYGAKFGNTVYCQGIVGTIKSVTNNSPSMCSISWRGTVIIIKRKPGRVGTVNFTVKSKPLTKPITYITPCKLQFQ